MGEVAERCDFRVGDCIEKKYIVEHTIGEGAFGKVFRVKTSKDGLIKALKLFKFWELNPDVRNEMIARTQMEFETGQIHSNYLVHSLESGMIQGNPYIVMEYCSNGDLRNYINSHQEVDLIKIGKEILYGLSDLHKERFIVI